VRSQAVLVAGLILQDYLLRLAVQLNSASKDSEMAYIKNCKVRIGVGVPFRALFSPSARIFR
jgi:hypothetical protein